MVKVHLRISMDTAILRRNMSPLRHRPSPTATVRMLWRDETQNRENKPMQSRIAHKMKFYSMNLATDGHQRKNCLIYAGNRDDLISAGKDD